MLIAYFIAVQGQVEVPGMETHLGSRDGMGGSGMVYLWEEVSQEVLKWEVPERSHMEKNYKWKSSALIGTRVVIELSFLLQSQKNYFHTLKF